MSVTLTGKIERKPFAKGVWALVTDDGKTYELRNPPQDLCQSQGKVRVEGQIRSDVMTIAMIGPVLEVKSFETL